MWGSLRSREVGSLGITLLFFIVFSGNPSSASFVDGNQSTDGSALNVDLDGNGLVTIDPQSVLDFLGETGSFVILQANPATFNCADVGEKEIVISGTDSDGMVSNFNALINVRDILPPVLVVEPATLVLDDNGTYELNWWEVVDTECDDSGDHCSKDNCSINYSLSKSSFDCNDLGENVVIVTATDVGGNRSTANVVVTLRDDTAPVLLTRSFTAGLNSLGAYDLEVRRVVDQICDVAGENCTKDNCGYTITLSKTHFTCIDKGVNNVIVTATDPSGNTTIGSADITIIDGTGPNLQIKDAILDLNENGLIELTASDVDNGTRDNCSPVIWSFSKSTFNCDDVGVHAVTVTASDERGYSRSGNVSVTIVDTMSPVVVTKNITIDLDPISGVKVIDPLDLLDLCEDAIVEIYDGGGADEFVPGTGENETIIYVLKDSGDCTRDNCKITNIAVDKVSFGIDDIGPNPVSIWVYDASSNVTIGSAIVTVNDPIPPTAISKNISIDLDIYGNASISPEDIDDGSNDNVSVVLSIDQASFTCENLGANTVTLTATDPSGNQAVTTSNVTVRDNIPPLVITKDMTVVLNEFGIATIEANELDNGSTDACEIASMHADKSSFDCNDLGEQVVALTVTDISGNEGTASATVTVTESTAPIIHPRNVTLDLNDEGRIVMSPEEVYSQIEEPCGLANVSVSRLSFECTDLGENTVTITATDDQGNTGTAEAIVTIRDVTPPVLAFNPIGFNLFANGESTQPISSLLRSYCGTPSRRFPCTTDNCGWTIMAAKGNEPWQSDSLTFNCGDAGGVYVRFRAEDMAGNVTIDSSFYEIGDKGRPEILAKEVTASLDGNGTVILEKQEVYESIFDPCGVANIEVSQLSFNCADLGANTVTITAIDVHGNTANAETVVTVVDKEPPVFETSDIEIELNDNGLAVLSPEMVYHSEADNCAFDAISVSKTTFSCNDLGVNTIQVIAVDASGNESSKEANVSVVDKLMPILVTKKLTAGLNNLGRYEIEPSDVLDFECDATGGSCTKDNCQLTYSLSQTEFDCDDLGENIIIVTAIDQSGNSVSENALVNIVNNSNPVARGKNITLALGEEGTVVLEPGLVDNGSTVNCGSLEFSVSKTTFNCSDVGSSDVELIVTTDQGLSDRTTIQVTIEDNLPPIVKTKNISIDIIDENEVLIQAIDLLELCPNAVIHNSEGEDTDEFVPGPDSKYGLPEEIIEFTEQCSRDNCGIAAVVASQVQFNSADIGENNVVVTVFDQNGVSTTASAIVLVNDRIPPTIKKQDVTIDLSPQGIARLSVDQVDMGSTDNVGILSRSLTQYEFDCSDVGENSVLFSVKDESGNETVSPVTVTVRDTTPPVLGLINLTVELNTEGNVSIQGADLGGSSNDACGIGSITLSKDEFDCENIGNNEVVVTVTDSHGNESTGMARVQVIDNNPPIIFPSNPTIELDSNGRAVVKKSAFYSKVEDNCEVSEISVSQVIFNCEDIGVNEVTITAEDSSGNLTEVLTTVEVVDNLAPIVVFNEINIQLDDVSGEKEVAIEKFIKRDCGVDGGQSCTLDNCGYSYSLALGSGAYSNSNLRFDCSHVGGVYVKARAIDTSGNESIDSVFVQVEDSFAPVLKGRDFTLTLNDEGKGQVMPTDLYAEFTDQCGVGSVELSKSDFDCSNLGENLVTVTGQDIHGNEISSQVTVGVIDVTKPKAISRSLAVYLDENGSTTITTADVDNGSFDRCGSITLSLEKGEFNCMDLGENDVKLMVLDESGLTDQSSFVVDVRDTIPPVIIPRRAEARINEEGRVIVQAEIFYTSFVDNCSTDRVEIDKSIFTCDDVGINDVILKAYDKQGNVSEWSSQLEVIDDRFGKVVGKSIEVEIGESGQVQVTPDMVNNNSVDVCGIAEISLSQTSFDCADLGENSVVLTAIDIHGNQANTTISVTVVDNQAPVMETKSAIIELDLLGNAELGRQMVLQSVSDNCGIKSVSLSEEVFSCADLGENTIVVSVEDFAGNLTESTATVSVVDHKSPVITEKLLDISLDAEGKALITSDQLYSEIDDNCEIDSVTLSRSHFGCLDVGVNQVTINAVDKSGNRSTEVTLVTVKDDIPPIIRLKDIELELNQLGQVILEPHHIDAGSFDACGIEQMFLSKNSFDCNDLGEHQISLTAIDKNGNEATGLSKVSIVDKLRPILEVKNVSISLNNLGEARLDKSVVVEREDDNCNVSDVVLSQEVFNCAHIGLNEIIVKIQDGSGNVTEKKVEVTIIDSTKPTVITQSVTVKLDKEGTATITPQDIDNGSYDGCGNLKYQLDKHTFDCSDLGQNTVNLTIIDSSGNSAGGSATVTVIDDRKPEIKVMDSELFLNESGEAILGPESVYTSVGDNCEIDEIILSQSSFSCQDVGEKEVLITVKDKAGNQTLTTAKVYVKDTISPVMVTKDIRVSLDQRGRTEITPELIDNGSADPCGIRGLRLSQTEFNCQDLGVNRVVLTGVDNNGNESSNLAIVEIVDDSAPLIEVKPVRAELGYDGKVTIPKSSFYNSITDNCELLSVEVDQVSFTCDDVGEVSITIRARDKYGNASSRQTSVTILDVIAPKVRTKNLTIPLNSSGTAVVTPEQIDNGSSDACGIREVSLSQTIFSCDDLGINEVKLKVIDVNNNVAEAAAVVTIVDEMGPEILPNDIVVNLDGSGRVRLAPDRLYSAIKDPCGISVIDVDRLAFECSDIGEHEVLLTARDNHGNVSTALSRVVVRDNTNPVVRPKDLEIDLDAQGKAVIRPLDVDNGSFDNCGITLSLDQSEFDCSHVGTNNVLLTATDPSGNTSSGIAKVIVGGNDLILTATNQLSMSGANPVCENAMIGITLQNTIEGIIYSLIASDGSVLSRDFGNNGDLRVQLSENAIDRDFFVHVSNDLGCSVQTDISGRLVNADQIRADFDRDGSGDILVDVPVQFYDGTVGRPVSWQWATRNDTVNLQNPMITFRQQGVQSVKLVVDSNQGCSSERIRNYTVEGEWMAEAPSAFSPNAALPENRTFKVITRGLRKERLIIYDRSGRVVHDGENLWSGMITVGGVILPGPYMFEFKAETVSGVPIFKRGRFLLL